MSRPKTQNSASAISASSAVNLPPRKRDSSGRFIPSGRSLAKIQNLGSGFDGASWWSPQRGYVYYPTLDSKKDLTTFDLYELRKRSRWLYNNSGFTTRCIDGIANMVGELTPVPQTTDTDWNLAALASFNQFAANNLTFDASGKYNFWSAQPMLTRLRLLDGDIGCALTETDSGIASVMFYEAHQIDNSSDTQLDQSQWLNGVRKNAQGRPIGYRIVTGDDIYGNFAPANNGQRSVDIPASDFIFHCEYRRPGRVRGEPALRHAVNNLIDRSEIMAFTKTSIKNASMIGFQIVRQASQWQGGPVLPPKGTGAGVQDITVYDSLTGLSNVIKAENPYGSGKQVEMDPGEEIKLLADERPHPNQVEFLDYLARDISWGLNCSSDILWNMAKLGGATARYVMADAQQTLVEPFQKLLADQFCTRFWVYYVAKEMKAGRLRKCQDEMWWKVSWQPQRKLTVDIGRDGKLYLDMHKSGLISLQRFHASLGQNWIVETDNYLKERKHIVDRVAELGMTMDQAFPPEPGSANIQQRESLTSSPEEQVTKPTNKMPAKYENLLDKALALLGKKSEAGPSITVNTPPPVVNIENLKIPEQKAPVVNVAPPVVHVGTPPAPVVNIQAPAPTIVPPPVVNIAAPPAPVVNVEVKLPRTKNVKFSRDEQGKITSAEIQKE